MSIWKVEDDRQISFEFEGHPKDLREIAYAWEGNFENKDVVSPIAWTASATEHQIESTQRGCMPFLIETFLKPIPMVFAFYWYGLWAAIVAALIVWVVHATYRLCSTWSKLKVRWHQYAWLIVPSATISSLYTGDEFYFKLLPTLWCISCAVFYFIELLKIQRQEIERHSALGQKRWWIQLSLLGASIVAAFISEYMRGHLETEAWIWYYAYIRIELIVLLIPAGIGIAFMTTSQQADQKKDASTQ